MRITVVVRPPAAESRLEELRAAISAIRGEGHRVRVRETFEPGDARRYARAAALAGCDIVVAAGGDGTVNEVVNGLARAGGDARLGVVPLGTANDFARGLGVPLDDVEAALRIAAGGRVLGVDVARVNRRCFINVSTGGFGAATTRMASRGAKRRFGPFAYMLRGARNFMSVSPVSARFRADDVVIHDGPFMFFAAGNARLTGGGNIVTPEADIRDGKLDVVIVRALSRGHLLTLLPDLRAGTHLSNEHVTYVRAHRVSVRAHGALSVNADGEMVAGTTFDYDVLKRPVEVMVP